MCKEGAWLSKCCLAVAAFSYLFSMGSYWECFREKNEVFYWLKFLECFRDFCSGIQALARSSVSSCAEEVMMQTGMWIVQKAGERCHFPAR